MKKIAIALYFLGLILAIVSAAHYTETMTTKDILLNPVFIIGMVMSLGGLVWWRSLIKTVQSDLLLEESEDSPHLLITSITKELHDLVAKMQNYGREDWLDHLTRIQDQYIMRFNDQRHQLLESLSAEEGSELMIKFSYGERMLNRAYSCSADGYHHEGIDLAPTALSSFEECLVILKK